MITRYLNVQFWCCVPDFVQVADSKHISAKTSSLVHLMNFLNLQQCTKVYEDSHHPSLFVYVPFSKSDRNSSIGRSDVTCYNFVKHTFHRTCEFFYDSLLGLLDSFVPKFKPKKHCFLFGLRRHLLRSIKSTWQVGSCYLY